MKVTRRSFLVGTGSSAIARPAFADTDDPEVTAEPGLVRITYGRDPAWVLKARGFGPSATVTANIEHRAIVVNNATFSGGAPFGLRLQLEKAKRWQAHLQFDGLPVGEAVADLAAVMDGSAGIDAPLTSVRARSILADTTGLSETKGMRVRIPNRVRLTLRRPIGRHGTHDGSPSFSLGLEALRSQFQFPCGIRTRSIRLAPAPQEAGPDWRAELVGTVVPKTILLGRAGPSIAELGFSSSATASIVSKKALDEPRLRLTDRIRLDVVTDAVREGPVRGTVAELYEADGLLTASLRLEERRWLLETSRGLFGISGGTTASTGARADAYTATATSKNGRLTAFDVPVGLHEHGVQVPGTDLARFDFGGATTKLRLKGIGKADDGLALVLGEHPGAKLAMPLEQAHLRLVEGRSLMSLVYRFKGIDLVDRGGHRTLEPRAAPAVPHATCPPASDYEEAPRALLVVDFPPQHLMEKAYLKQEPILPDREIPVAAADLRSVRSGQDGRAAEARKRIATAKLNDEACDKGLDGSPADRPFAKFSELWKSRAKDWPEEVPWIGPTGLLSVQARQAARQCAAEQRAAGLTAIADALSRPPAIPAALQKTIAEAMAALALPSLGLSQSALQIAGELQPATPDSAVKSMFDVAIKASNDDLRELQNQWTAWRKDHPSPVQTFLTSLWPTELASQALLDAVLPADLKGQAPARVADADAAAFLAGQLRTTGANELADSHAVLTLPNECHLSGPSRLAFVVPTCPAKPLPLSRAALTDWSGFDLHVVRRAVRWHDDKPQAKNRKKATLRKVDQILAKLDFAVSGTVSIDDWMSMVVKDAKEPGVLQTALELPSRLIMSPAQDVRWVTPRGLPPDIARRFDPERNAGIWQAEFFETDADEPSLRAVWSRDFRRDAFTDPVQNHPPSPGAWAPWAPDGKVPFRTSVDALDRHELVGLTSLYGLPVLARRDADGTLDATQARIPDGLALKDLKNKNDVALYLPQGLAPRRLALSSLGASLDLDASFTPPATAYRGRGPGKDTELFNSFSLARFSMQTSYGYDEVVEVVRKGFLMPLGHTAAFVKTTRREIWDQGAGPLAYPVQRLTVQVTKAEQLYGRTGQRDQGRGFPARSIELVTLRTPDLIDPLLTAAPAGTTSDAPLTHNAVGRVGGMVGGGTANTGQTGRATSGLVFWPRTQPNEAGNVRFRMRIDGSADTVYMPLLFLDNQAAHDADTVEALVRRYYNRSADQIDLTRWNVVRHGGATRAYGAEAKPGDTSFATDWQEVDAEGRDGAAPYTFDPTLESLDQPPFFPALRLAQVQAAQIGRLTGLPAPVVRVDYSAAYRDHGFRDEAQGKRPVLYLDVVGDRPSLDMGKQGDRAGGLGRPSQVVIGFSRAIGPVGGSPNNHAAAASRVRYAQAGQILADAAPAGAGAGAGAVGAATSFFDDHATLLGIVKLNDLIKILAVEAERNNALPALKEVTEYAEQGGSQALKALDKVAQRLTKAIDDSGARGVGYDTIGKQADEFRKAVQTAEGEKNQDDLPGDLADVWSSGQRLAAELQRLAQAPLAPAIDFFTGRLREMASDLEKALSQLDPVEAARQAAAKALADLASKSGWAQAIVSLSLTAGLPEEPAKLIAGKIQAAASDVNTWLAPDPAAALAAKVKDGLAPELAAMIDEDALLGPLWSQFDRLIGTITHRLDQAFQEMSHALGPLEDLAKRYQTLVTSAAKLCADGTQAARAWVSAAMPADAIESSSLAAIADASDDVQTLGADLAKLVTDLPKSDWDKAQPIIDWSNRIKGQVAKASAFVTSEAAAVRKARSDVLDALGTGSTCPTPASLASIIDAFEGARRNWGAALSSWFGALADKVPADPGMSGKAGSRIQQAADKIRASTGAAVRTVQQTTLAATAAGAFPPPELKTLFDADAAIRTVLGDKEDGVAAAINKAAVEVSQLVDEAADLASGAARSLDESVKAADRLVNRAEDLRKELEAEARAILGRVLQAALSPIASDVEQALTGTFAAASGAAGALYGEVLKDRKSALDYLKQYNDKVEELLGPPPTPADCPGGWAEALLLVKPAGSGAGVACTAQDDALAKEAAEVATPDGFATALARWEGHVDPVPLVLVRQAGRLAETSVRAAVTRLLDVQGLRQQLLDALLDVIPLRRRLTYDMTLPLNEFDAGFLTLEPEDKGALVLSSETTLTFDPNKGPALTSTFSGKLSAVAIDVPSVLRVSFNPISFSGGTGRASSLDAKLKNVKIGSSLDVLTKLEGLLNGRDGGPYVKLHQERPAIEVGYLLSVGTFTIGDLAILNINFLAALVLPFDGTDARIHLSLGTIDQPFLLSAAPYGGGGFFGLEAGATGITASEVSFEYGGVAAVAYGPIQAVGRITTGLYVRQSAGGTVLSAIFFAGFSGHIACFGIATSFTLRLAHQDGKMSGTATLEFTFSFGFGHVSFSVSVGRSVDSNLHSASLAAPEGPIRLASLDGTFVPSGPDCASGGARIVTACVGAEQDWFAHEAYYDQGLRPAEMTP